jgi:murein L,D-transpeptidase YcbB/YkuD
VAPLGSGIRNGYHAAMKLSLKIGAALAFCAAAALAPCSTFAQAAPATIRTLAVQASTSAAQPTGPYDERGWLDRFYGPRKYAPAWNPTTAAAALWVLNRATLQGLDPRDYGADALQRQLRAGEGGADGARFDVALTSAMLHYLADLRVGRVRSEYHTRLPDARLRQYDPVERLRAGLAGGKLQAAVKAAEPQLRLYGQVKAALAHYRELAKQPYPALPAPGAIRRRRATCSSAWCCWATCRPMPRRRLMAPTANRWKRASSTSRRATACSTTACWGAARSTR